MLPVAYNKTINQKRKLNSWLKSYENLSTQLFLSSENERFKIPDLKYIILLSSSWLLLMNATGSIQQGSIQQNINQKRKLKPRLKSCENLSTQLFLSSENERFKIHELKYMKS